MTGFLQLETILKARVRAAVAVPGLKVLGAPELAGVKANAQPTPAVHVVFDGFAELTEERGVLRVAERWLTVLAVRNARSTRSGDDAREDAGPILDALFAALHGWTAPGVKPLIPAVPPLPGFDAGFAYFPLAWIARRTLVVPCQVALS